MANKRVIDQQELTSLSSGWYAFLDHPQNGTKKFSMDRLSSAIDDANAAAAEAADKADAAEEAAADAVAASERAVEAAEAAEGVILDALPTMTANLKGGAILGSGLEIDSDTLSIDLTDNATGESITAADASYLANLVVDGKAVQDGTPTPSAPVDVQVVQGRNLIQLNSSAGQSNVSHGVTWTLNSDGSITVKGTADDASYCTFGIANWALLFSCTTESGNYRATAFTDSGISSKVRLRAGYGVSATNIGNAIGSWTVPVPTSGDVYIGLFVMSGTVINETIYVQFEHGTTSTPYTPYGSIGLKVNGGKNRMPDKVYQLAVSGSYIASSSNYRAMYAPVEAGKTYTVSRATVKGNRFRIYTTTTEPDVGVATDFAFGDNDTALTATVTIPSGAKWLFIYLANDGSDVSGMNMQLEEGSTATDYIPFCDLITPIDLNGEVLAGISGVKDVLNIDSVGHKLKDKRIGVVDLGTLEWTMQSSGVSGKYRAKSYITNIKMASSSGSVPNVICSRFAAITGNAAWNMTNGVSVASNEHAIYCCDDNYSSSDSAAAFKTAMSGVLLYYELATPQTIDLGYIGMPPIADGVTISITAQVTPTITASWWARGAAAIAEALKAVRARINAIEAAIAELATA